MKERGRFVPKNGNTPPPEPAESFPPDVPAGADIGQAEVQETVDAENAQGFRGVKVDPTPDEHYTVAGVIEGLPTPENHAGRTGEEPPAPVTDEGKA
jgi:hypothetical protein